MMLLLFQHKNNGTWTQVEAHLILKEFTFVIIVHPAGCVALVNPNMNE